jgi:hypothetical protein
MDIYISIANPYGISMSLHFITMHRLGRGWLEFLNCTSNNWSSELAEVKLFLSALANRLNVCSCKASEDYKQLSVMLVQPPWRFGLVHCQGLFTSNIW